MHNRWEPTHWSVFCQRLKNPLSIDGLNEYIKGKTFNSQHGRLPKFGNETSEYAHIKEGVLQGSKRGPIAFVIKIDKLQSGIQNAAIPICQ